MLKPRLIPSLLIDENLHLTQTTQFKGRNYIGDPLNAAYVLSGYEVDELIVLDIDASKSKRSIPKNFVHALAHFTTVPLSVGGGISTLEDIQDILALGVEKVVLGNVLNKDLAFLEIAVNKFGSSTISVIINIDKDVNGNLIATLGSVNNNYKYMLEEISLAVEQAGAGEIIINNIALDGTKKGYDVEVMSRINSILSIPIVALGGCGKFKHIKSLLDQTLLSGVSAGSLFCYAPNSSHVLINYTEMNNLLKAYLEEIDFFEYENNF